MPVQLTPDVTWINECYDIGPKHLHVAVYLIDDGDGTILIDTGSFYHREAIAEQLRAITDGIDTIILSHGDAPHAGNVRAFNRTWDEVQLVAASGAPEIQGYPTDDYRPCEIDEDMHIEGRRFSFIDPPLADRSHTTWIYDHDSRVLVTADGFGNHHAAGECDLLSSEFDDGIPIDRIHDFHRDALRWLRYVDPGRMRHALESIFEAHEITYVAPIHGQPIAAADLDRYLDRLFESVRRISDSPRATAELDD